MLSACAVIKVVDRSEGIESDPDASWWRHNEITLVMSLITTIFPNIFELIGMLEKYHPRRQLRWQLARYTLHVTSESVHHPHSMQFAWYKDELFT